MCSNCATVVAKLWCRQCETSYCSQCYQLAHVLPVSRTHISISIDQKPITLVPCDQHPDEKLKFWCNHTTCMKLVCRDCIILQHQGHTCTLITDIAPSKMKELDKLFMEVKLSLDPFILQSSVPMGSDRNPIVEKLMNVFDHLRSIIVNYENELKQDICAIDERNQDLIQAFQTKLMRKREELIKWNNEFESTLSANDYTKLLENYQDSINYLTTTIQTLSILKCPVKTDYDVERINELEETVTNSLRSVYLSTWQQVPVNAQWSNTGITVAGGRGCGSANNQLNKPFGLYVDDDQTMIIADYKNHRIIQWKVGDNEGVTVAGGQGAGNQLDQLNGPTDVLVDNETDSLIICDRWNQRVIRWSRKSGTTQGEVLIDNIHCYGVAMDDQRYLYISDIDKHEVRRYQMGDNVGFIVAGGYGKGAELNQLNWPSHLFVDRRQTVYVSDWNNNRVMRWNKHAAEGIVVAGGQGDQNALTQLRNPNGLFVDTLGTLYVADSGNHRVMRWSQGSTQGTVIAGMSNEQQGKNRLDWPLGLSLDCYGNLYVVDHNNHRVQRFSIE